MTLHEIAEAINRLGGGKGGTKIDRKRVWNYVHKTTPPPWFIERLDQAFPGWADHQPDPSLPEENIVERLIERLKEAFPGWPNSQANSSLPEGHVPAGNASTAPQDLGGDLFHQSWDYRLPPTREVPLVPSIGSPEMLSELKILSDAPESPARKISIASLLGYLPLQRVESNEYAPAFKTGDALLLRPDAPLLVGRIYLIVDRASIPDESHYALLSSDDSVDDLEWVLYDGSRLDEGRVISVAAVAAHLPQFVPGVVDGSYSLDGLRAGVQVDWPKRKSHYV